jgi:hypothetical protein
MRALWSPSSAFATLFRPWLGLVAHPRAWRQSHARPGVSPRRFSPWFGRPGWCSHRCPPFRHRPASLVWRSVPLAPLPGTQLCLHQGTRQHQVIVHQGDDLAPAFTWRWRAQPRVAPPQAVRLFASALFVGVAPPLAQGHCWQPGLERAVPQQPTLERVAWPIRGPMTQHAAARHLQLSRLGQRPSVPPGDLDGRAFGIGALPAAGGLCLRRGGAALQALPLFPWRSTCAGACGSRTIQDPLACEPQHLVTRQPLGPHQHRGTTGAASAGHDGTTATVQQGSQLAQVLRCSLAAGLVRADALLREHRRPPAGLPWQAHDGRAWPARAARPARLRQGRLGDHGPSWRGLRLGALDPAGITTQPHAFSLDWPQQRPHQHAAHPLLSKAASFTGFVQAPPASLNHRRERPLGKRVCLRLGQPRISRVEQRVGCSGQPPGALVTKVLQGVQVQLSHAPVLV